MRLLTDRPSSTRTRTAAGLAALALLVGPLTACGSDDPADDAAASASSSDTAGTTDPTDPTDPAASTDAPGSTDGSAGAGGTDGSTGSTDGSTGTDGTDGTDGSTDGSGAGGADGGTSEGTTGSGSGSASDGTGGTGKGDSTGKAADPNSPFVVAATAVAARSRDQVTQLHAMGVATTGEGNLPADQLPALGENIRGELGRQIEDATMLPPPADTPAARLVSALEDYQELAGRLAAWDPAGAALPNAWFGRLGTADRAWKNALRDLGRLSEQDLLSDLAPLAMPS